MIDGHLDGAIGGRIESESDALSQRHGEDLGGAALVQFIATLPLRRGNRQRDRAVVVTATVGHLGAVVSSSRSREAEGKEGHGSASVT